MVSLFGSGSESGLPLGMIVVALVVGLAIGYLASNYFAGGQQQVASSGLTVEDKNFLVSVANAQVDLLTRQTALQSASLDWCTASGGQWLTLTRNAQVNVTSEQAQQLQQQGAQVAQQDGNLLATVVLIDRSSCVIVPTQAGAAGQQRGG